MGICRTGDLTAQEQCIVDSILEVQLVLGIGLNMLISIESHTPSLTFSAGVSSATILTGMVGSVRRFSESNQS
ncbi:hypothetical protein ElyMa_006708700 [Elysia marginata]|uniref:Uncharacterized protein n=1 Tax=Elysia marginata TaxID=1093978 RepID=A0AAV4IRS0_9GAST|nr:hypothetical protein ElyMa_006708700 [Elysia marginata]